MSYLVLARKWRPQNFDQVVGQESTTQTLKNAIKMGRVPHALLFSGPRGVGKTTMARLLAKALNCEKGPTDNPCDECASCRQITSGSNMDVLEIDGASNTGVDDVRQLRESVQYRPSGSRYRIYIIDEVHMLSRGAFNALLKTLEEPPEHVFFIFATTEPHKVPQTIQSRCQRFDFRRIPPPMMIARLVAITKAEGIKISDGGLRLLARQSEGSLRDAISLLDQAVSFSGQDIKDEKLNELLATVDRRHLFDLTEALISAQPRKAIEILNLVYERGYDLKQFLKELIDHFRDLLVVKLVDDSAGMVELSDGELEELKKQTHSVSEEVLIPIFEFLLEAEERMGRTEHPKVVLEFVLVKSASLKPMLKVEDLIGQLETLRKEIGSGKVRMDRDDFELEGGGNPGPAEPASSSRGGAGPSAKAESSAEPKTWQGFIGFLAKGWPGLAGILKNGKFGAEENGSLRIEFPQDDFCLELLKDQGRTGQLNQLAGEFFGRSLKVVCVAQINSHKTSEAMPPGRMKEKIQQELMNHPMVQKAVEIFGARLDEIKAKKNGQTGEK